MIVKGEPGRRQRKAHETRRRVLAAAERLFVGRGYTATTMTAIADEADLAVQTLYASFGTKRAILSELIAARVVGDDDATPLRDRDEFRAMEQENDPRRQLALLAGISTRIGARIGHLYDVLSAAASSDPEIAVMYQAQRESPRYQDQRRVARSLARRGALRAGLTERRATDITWAIANPRTYRSLVGERGWTESEYEAWLAHLLCGTLLDPSC